MPNLEATVAALPAKYPGPGGAIAILHNGKPIVRHSWGYADTALRVPFTPATMFLICSITKQFTCGLMLDRFPDPTVLNPDIAARMPLLQAAPPSVLHCAHNQSGLRDYWATAMLTGPKPEDRFTQSDANRLIARTQTLHFTPGTRYSYCNQNFRMISEIIEHRTGRTYAELLRERIFDRVGMPTAQVNAEASTVQGGTIGYEGSLTAGWRPAINNINWTGDAGIAASLDDFIAWETHIDATRDDPTSLYQRLSTPTHFSDGAPAFYGFGLNRAPILNRQATAHGGGLRGWRSFRFYLPTERISVVCLFNHMADPRAAALDCLCALLNEPQPAAPTNPTPLPTWTGRYQEPESGLAVQIETIPDPDQKPDTPSQSRIKLSYSSHGAEILTPQSPTEATTPTTRLHAEPDGLYMTREIDHQSTRLTPVEGTPTPTFNIDIAGTYHSPELAADLTITDENGALYAAFSGDLGQGEMQPLRPFAQDLWLMPCPRALDHGAPGDWTIQITRTPTGQPAGLRLGCWLARNVEYEIKSRPERPKDKQGSSPF